MPGWTRQKRTAVEKSFYNFLNRCYVNSRDSGRICLGEHLFFGQRLFITETFDALEEDIHKILVLKSRQLGLSTIARALIMFMMGIHAGLKGAIVFDTDGNKNESRAELETMIEELPKSLKFPTITSTNRVGLTLGNNSKALFMSAGTRKTKTSGTLGRSVGLSLAHLSELCSYDNPEGLESFENSLSDANPDRLYIYESTARGFNDWNTMWEQARNDPAHCRCIFLGWWSKDNQRIEQDHPDYQIYGIYPPSPKEESKIRQVKEKYNFDIDAEQLAWVRRKMDPTGMREGDADPEFEGNTSRIQEQPWTEEEAFQQTGSVFFSNENLTEISNKHVSPKFSTYMYHVGAEFSDMRIFKADNARSVELKIWEEPDSQGCYVLGIDPAFGENEKNDRSSIFIGRCYADGMDQVAEYNWPLISTRQFAWAIASLLGWYGIGEAEVRYILELNGPGGAVFEELKALKNQIEGGYRAPQIEEKGLKDIFRNVRTYIYSRVDSVGGGNNWHFKTQLQTKILIMERLRDSVSTDKLHIRSADLIKEMRSISREGDKIEGPSNGKDDRVLAAALANYYWESKIRRSLIASKRTRETEAAKKRLTIHDQVYLFQQNQLSAMFDGKRRMRTQQLIQQSRQRWRHGR